LNKLVQVVEKGCTTWNSPWMHEFLCTMRDSKRDVGDEDDDDLDKSLLNDATMMLRWVVSE